MSETSLGSNNPFRRKSSSNAAPAPPTTDSPGPDLPSPSRPAIDPLGRLSSLATSDSFRSQLEAQPHSSQPLPPTSFKKKVVKKVRVQSPPPSSPESISGAPDRFPAIDGNDEHGDSSSSSSDAEETSNPFANAGSAVETLARDDTRAAAPSSRRPPPNPFQKTLEDMEESAQGRSASTSTMGRGSLDVDSFRRLLMTGQAHASTISPATAQGSSPQPPNMPAPGGDAASITDASSIWRQSLADAAFTQDTPRTSHEISEPEIEEDRLGLISNPVPKSQQSASTLRKKPPPPSSRHGKSIPTNSKSNRERSSSQNSESLGRPTTPSNQENISPTTSPTKQRPSTPSDVNKPLPPAPATAAMDNDNESIFDKEAAGKVPETDIDLDSIELPPARPPTPPNASHSLSSGSADAQASRKPAPPPRRNQHSRAESKAAPSAATAGGTAPGAFTEEPETVRRSSLDSTRSRTSSLRVSVHAPPAPPPPRRPAHVSRPSNASFTSPSALSFSSVTSGPTSPTPSDAPPERSPISQPTTTSNMADAAPSSGGSRGTNTSLASKLSPPAPPPARNTSIRTAGRPPSLEARRAGRDKDASSGASMAPPPPPPKKRGRVGSRDSVDAPARRLSSESMQIGAVTEESFNPENEGVGTGGGDSAAKDILADLDALQREVDALRGKI